MKVKYLVVILYITIYSCTPSLEPAVYTKELYNKEKFKISGVIKNVEFVKDTVEYIKFIGNYITDASSWQMIDTINYGSYTYIYGGDNPNHFQLDKIEVHYKKIREIYCDYPAILPAQTSIAPIKIDYSYYTREAIQEDSLKIQLYSAQDSIIEVSTDYLELSLMLDKFKIKGNSNKLVVNLLGGINSASFNEAYDLNLKELVVDSAFIKSTFFTPYWSKTTNIYVHANDYLFLHLINDSDPVVNYTIYYTGNPTIINVDSLDSRVQVIDNN